MALKRIDRPNKRLSLDDIATDPPRHVSHDQLAERRKELAEELFELQDLMWGARTHSVLVVLQGRDTAGKDGTIKEVVGALNPRGVNVVSFGVPTQEEREHDFLWRVHRHAPRAGEFAIFNRSHYEDVLVARVHELVPKEQWSQRYAHINDFERLLAESGCIVLKFFLHISKAEQKKRLLERETDVTKAWKLNPDDWRERELWKPYTHAYEGALSRCAGKHAPWYVVPADHKWYRDFCVAEAVADALRPYREHWVQTLSEKGKLGRSAIEAFRKKHPKT